MKPSSVSLPAARADLPVSFVQFLRRRSVWIAFPAVTCLALGPLATSVMAEQWDPALSAGTALGGAGVWDITTANWWDGATNVVWPNSGTSAAVFGGAAGGAVAITTGSGVTANSLVFSTTGYTLTGSVAADVLNLSGVTPGIMVVNPADTATINAIITGTSGFTKSGAGTLALGGVNTFMGGTSITGGILNATNLGALGADDVSVSGGGKLLVSTATGVWATNVNLDGGTFGANLAGTISLTAGKTLTMGASGGGIEVGPSGLAASKILLGVGQLAGSGELTKSGLGVLQLSGANAGFSGPVTINAGTIEFQNADSLGTAATTITVNNGGDIATSGANNRNNITLNAGGTISANNVAANYTGTVNVAGNATAALRTFQAVATANSFAISGPITGAGNLTATAPAAATLTLTGSRAGHTGQVVAGTNATVLYSNASTLNSTSGLGLAGGTAQIRSVNALSPTLGTAGLTGTYYNFGSNPGTGANQFAADQLYLAPRAFTRTDANINMPNTGAGNGNTPIVPVLGYAYGTGQMGQQDGVMWKGLINITNAGTYQFSGTNDDNLVLYIDGVQIGTLGVTANNVNIGAGVPLTSGSHSIVVKMTQGGGGGYSTISYNGGAGSDAPTTTLIPPSALTNGSLANLNLGPLTVAGGTLDIVGPSSSPSATLGNGTWTLTSPTIDNLTVASATINAATPTLAPTTTGLIFTGAIGEDVPGRALNVAGPYFTEFQGANTYTGLTTVSGGQLRLNSGAGNSIAGNLTINAGNAGGLTNNVVLNQSNQIADTATVTMTQGILDIGANSDTVGNLVMNGGTISGTSGVLTIAGSTPTLTGGTISANLAGNFTLAKTGTGLATLAGNNSYTGLTNVTAGALVAQGQNSLGAGGAGNETVVSSGATLRTNGALVGTEDVSIAGTGLAGDTSEAALRNLGGISSINNLTTTAASTVRVDSGEVMINGVLNTGAGALTKTGNGTLTFTSNQATIPAVTHSAGAIGFSGTQSFGAAAVPAGLAYSFNSNPLSGGGSVALTVGPTSSVIANYAADQSFLSVLAAGSTGSLALTGTNPNNLDFSGTPNVGLSAKGLATYNGNITPNAAGYNFGGLSTSGLPASLNQLTVNSTLVGTNPVSITGGLVGLNGDNTFTGTITAAGGTLRFLNSTNLGNTANGITLNGGTLQAISNGDNTGAALYSQLGNPLAGAARAITVGAGGGTIDVPARQTNGNSFAITGTNGLTGSGALNKTGLGFFFAFTPNNYSGNLNIAANGGTFDIRSNGALPNVASITVGQSSLLNVDAQNGLARQWVGAVAITNRVNDSAAINLNGGSLTFTSRSGTLSSAETFGTVNLGIGQSALNANSNSGGNSSSLITFGGLNRAKGSTLRFGGTTGTLGVVTANNTQFKITGQAAATILPYASLFGTNFAAYDATNGVVTPTLTAATASAQFVAANIADQTGDVTLAAGNKEVNGLRQTGGATRNLTFTNGADTLFITSGGYISDGSNNARNIGVGGAAVATNLQGQLTAGPLAANAAPRELFLHNNANTLTVFSKIVDNNGQLVTVVKDLDGTVTLQPNINMTATWAANVNNFTVADTSTIRVGQPIIGVAGSAFVASIIDGTHFTANGAPTGVGTGANINLGTPNTFGGGVFVTRGQLNSSAVGALGNVLTTSNPTVVVKNATLQLNNIGGVVGTVPGAYTGAVYDTQDQGAIILNAGSATAAGQYNTNTDRFSIGAGSIIANPGTQGANAGFNSLTRVATPTSFTGGGQIYLAPGAIVRHNLTNAPDQGTGILTIKNLGTDADLYFAPANFGGVLQTVTVGAGTPWRGLSSDRGNLTWTGGTIYANSDFSLQGLTRDGGIAALILGSNSTAGNNIGGLQIVNNTGGPINANVIGNVIINEDEPVSMPSNLTFTLTPGSIFQPNTTMAMGFGSSQAKILVQAGATLDPGNYIAIGAAANTNKNPDGTLNGTQNLPYAVPSPVNGPTMVEAGGRFLINDASGIGSAPVGSWTMKTDSILDLGSSNAFYGRGNYPYNLSGPIDTTGVIQNGQFNYENGVIVRIQADNIYKLSQFMPNGSTQSPVIEIFNGNRNLTNQNNPFIVPVVGTPTIAPETITLANGGMLTNDSTDRSVNEGRGSLALGDGAILSATSQTVFNIQEGVSVSPGATVTIGSSKWIDGNPKTGLVQLSGPQSNTLGAGAKIVVGAGSALGLAAANTYPDNAPIELPFAVTNVAPAGALGFNPGNGSTLLSNVGNFAEIVGPVTGNGSVISNAGGAFLGLNVASDYTTNIAFRSANANQAQLWKIGSGVLSYTGTSDSTGQVWVGAGELKYINGGNSAFSENRLQKGGLLTLDNTGTALSNRLGGSVLVANALNKSVTPMGGTLNLIGNASTAVEERFANLFNSAGGSGPFQGVTGTTTLKISPGAAATTILVNSAENFQAAGIGQQRSGTYIINTPTVANAPMGYTAAGGITGAIVPGAGAGANGLLQIASPNFATGVGGFGVQAGGVFGSAGTQVAATRPDYLGDATGDGIADGFMTQDGVFHPVTNTSGTAVLTGLPTTAGLTAGMLVQGSVPNGTRILSVDSLTQVTLTNNTTAAATNMQFISGGMRNLAASEYSPTFQSNMNVGLNVKLSGTASPIGDTRVTSLTMTPGSILNIGGTLPLGASASRVHLNSGGIFVQAGGTATINGTPFGTSRSFLQINGGASLFLHTVGDLNLNAAVFTDNAIVKTGAGTVNVGDHAFDAFRGSLQIDEGTVNLGTNNGFSNIRNQTGSGTNAHLYINGGTLNLGGNSMMINTLNNNNELTGMGGKVTSASPATLTVTGGGRFSGTVEGAISIDKNANNTLLLTNDNSYTGSTLVRSGTLVLRDSGKLSGTSAVNVQNATLQLDNSFISNVTDRIPASTPVNLFGGTVNLTGAAGQVASQTFNNVTLTGGLSNFTSNAGGSGANVITIGNLARTAGSGSVVNFGQNYGFLGAAGNTTAIRNYINNVGGSPVTLTNNILPAWIIANGDHFATYNATTGLSFLSNTADGYANYDSTDATTASVTQNVNDGAARTFATTKTINAWRMAPGAAITNTYNDGVGLTIASGGLISNANQTISHAAAANARNNFITSSTGELDYWVNQNTNGINIPVTGAIDLVKTGPGGLNLAPASILTGTVTAASDTILMANTNGLEVGDAVSAGAASTFPAGTYITAITPGVSIKLNNPAGVAGADFRATFGNSYTGKTIVNGGTLTLNQLAAGPNAVAIPGDLYINAATVTEANVVGQLKSNANIYISGGGRLNMLDAAGVTETIGSVNFLDGSSGAANSNLDRTASRLTSIINLSSPTALTATNTNPSNIGTPLVGGFAGTIGFTNTGGSTMNINSPTALNGVLAVGLRIAARIGSVPTGVAEGGLIKTGTGLLVIGPDQNPTFGATGGTTINTNVITGLVGAITGTTPLVVGQTITGSVAGIPANSYIVSIDSDTQIKINQNATATTTANTITGLVMNQFGNPTTLTDVFNIQSGVVRFDTAGAMGSNNANTTVQSGAVLLGSNTANTTMTGSVTLKAGSTMGATINSFVLGAATTTPANQSVFNVPSGAINIAAYDYYVPNTNSGNITINGKFTGAGTINIVGQQLTQGGGGGGTITFGNPILTGTGSSDFSGTINVGINAILNNQVATIPGAGLVRSTGNALGTATINLTGGRLRLRDDLSGTVDVSNTTITYGNNVNLLADSYMDANRASSTTATGNIINLGSLTVTGNRVLNVDSGNNYQIGFSTLTGTGNLIKAGGGRLNINAIDPGFGGDIGMAGPVGLAVAPTFNTTAAQNLVLPATANISGNFNLNGLYITEAGKTLSVANNFNVNSNPGNVSGMLAVTNTTILQADTFVNNGQVGAAGGTATITANGFMGNGHYVTSGQALNLAGGVTSGTLKVAGNNTVSITGSSVTPTATEVQSGVLRIAPNSAATTSGDLRVFGSPSSVASGSTAPIAAVSATLRLDGSLASISHTGNVTNNGLVQVSAGTATISGVISGTPVEYVPGLLEGFTTAPGGTLPVDNTRVANPGNFGIRLEPRMLQTNAVTQQVLTGHVDNDTWIYTGYVKDDDGVFSFAENIDDRAAVWVDGALVLNAANGGGSRVVSTAFSVGQGGTGVVTAGANLGTPSQNFGPGITLPGRGAGWHLIEIRMNNGNGGSGPIVGNGFNVNYGFGYKNGIAALDGADMTKPIDNGTGNLFVTPVGGKGTIQVDASSTLTAGGTTQTAAINLNGGSTPATAATVKLTGAAYNSDADALNVNGGTTPQGNVNADAGHVLSVPVINVAAGGNLNVNPTGGTGEVKLVGGGSGATGNGTGAFTVAGGTFNITSTAALSNTADVFVTGGNFRVDGTATAANVTVNGTGMLSGVGVVNATITQTGGFISPGNSPGVLTTNGNIVSSGGEFKFELNGPTPGTGYDQLVLNGSLSLTGTTVATFTSGYTPNPMTDWFYLIKSSTPITGIFAGLSEGTPVTISGQPYYATYQANSATNSNYGGNDFALIPEPGSMLMMLFASFLCFFRRRRRE